MWWTNLWKFIALAFKPFVPAPNVWGYMGVLSLVLSISSMGIVGFMPGLNEPMRSMLLVAILIILLLIAGTKQQGTITKHKEIIHEYQGKLKDRTNYKEILDQLAWFNKKAREILEKVSDNLTLPLKEYQDWQRQVYEYLRINLGESYCEVFLTGAGMGSKIGNPPIGLESKSHQALWYSIQAQKLHLKNFTEEFWKRERELIRG